MIDVLTNHFELSIFQSPSAIPSLLKQFFISLKPKQIKPSQPKMCEQ